MANLKRTYKYHTVYVTTLTGDDGEYYYCGKHSTNNINDNYYGSGNNLKKYIEYGYSPIKEVVAIFDNPDDAFLYEKKIIDEYRRTKGERCLNLCDGGIGISKGFKFSDESIKRRSIAHTGLPWSVARWESHIKNRRVGESHHLYGRKLSEEHKRKIGDAIRGDKHWTNYKSYSKEHCLKISERMKGEKNPMFGKVSPNRGKIIYNKTPVDHLAEELFVLWNDNDKPSPYKFIKLAVANNYPDISYKSLIRRFTETGQCHL